MSYKPLTAACLGAIALLVGPLGLEEAHAAKYPDVVWESTVDEQVRLELEDGSEVSGKLLGYSDGTIVLAKNNGDVVSLDAAKVTSMKVVGGSPGVAPSSGATPAPPTSQSQAAAREHIRRVDRTTYSVGARTVDWSEAQFILTGFHQSQATLRKGRGHLNAAIILSSIATMSLAAGATLVASADWRGKRYEETTYYAVFGGVTGLSVALAGAGFGVAAGADDRAIERYNRAVDRGAYVPDQNRDASTIDRHRRFTEPFKVRRGAGIVMAGVGGIIAIVAPFDIQEGESRWLDDPLAAEQRYQEVETATVLGVTGALLVGVGLPLALLPPPHGVMPRRVRAGAEVSVGLGTVTVRY